MTTPTPRTPVRPARGTKTNLDTGLTATDIKEGELVYAKDEDKLYMVEGGTFIGLGADLSTSSIDDLSDVDTTTVAPTDGQALVWDNANSQWEPGTVSGGGGGNTYIANYGDIYWSSVADQISFDGLTNGTQNSWTNIGNDPLTWTSLGAITTSLSKWGTSSLDNETASTSLQTTGYALNQESFTFEAWMYWDNANRGAYAPYLVLGAGFSAPEVSIYVERNNLADSLKLNVTQNSSLLASATTGTVTNNAWHHLAMVRDGSTISLYVDGSRSATVTNSSAHTSTPWKAGGSVKGLNDLRFTRGIARYTGLGFVPPNAAFYASAAAPIDALSDVDTTTNPPTDGQVLRWNSATSSWEPQDLDEVIDGGNLETGTSAGDGTTIDGGLIT